MPLGMFVLLCMQMRVPFVAGTENFRYPILSTSLHDRGTVIEAPACSHLGRSICSGSPAVRASDTERAVSHIAPSGRSVEHKVRGQQATNLRSI